MGEYSNGCFKEDCRNNSSSLDYGKEVNVVTTQPKQEPVNSDILNIMFELKLIEAHIKKVDKRTSHILYWLWGVLIGALAATIWS